jgi:hypothetical protein
MDALVLAVDSLFTTRQTHSGDIHSLPYELDIARQVLGRASGTHAGRWCRDLGPQLISAYAPTQPEPPPAPPPRPVSPEPPPPPLMHVPPTIPVTGVPIKEGL